MQHPIKPIGNNERVSALFEAALSECSMGGNLSVSALGKPYPAGARQCDPLHVRTELAPIQTDDLAIPGV